MESLTAKEVVVRK
ncbi:hypothetical protein RDI58_022640 [Solanum bulbocastanum]|uniref:Uncharacterized protein n=1 Tax=Solanum bulbocastanum TaxID=147425 RepID=A0AAN8TB19_SOLBU